MESIAQEASSGGGQNLLSALVSVLLGNPGHPINLQEKRTFGLTNRTDGRSLK
jgi:hypothetical protein